jgi:hypothetical protein
MLWKYSDEPRTNAPDTLLDVVRGVQGKSSL